MTITIAFCTGFAVGFPAGLLVGMGAGVAVVLLFAWAANGRVY